MKVYNYDLEGYLLGVSELDNSDKCQITGDWLIPAQATDKEPLQEKEGFEVKFIDNEWQYIKLLTDEEKKINGELPLEKGEIIQDNHLIKLEKPSELHSWDGIEWHLDEEKIRISKLPSKEGFEVKFIENEWQYIKLLTDEEKKIQGLIPLEDGEKIVEGILIKVESPSDLHSWNGSEWYLDEEKVRISKLPSAEELQKNTIEIVVLDLLTEAGVL